MRKCFCYILKKQAVELASSLSKQENIQLRITSGLQSGDKIIHKYSEISELGLKEGDEIIITQ